MQTSSRFILLSLVALAACEEAPAISGKYKGPVLVYYKPTAPGGETPAALSEKAAEEVEVTPLEDSKYRVSFGACSATFKRPEKSHDNKGIWKLVTGGPCATKVGDASITSGELIDFGKGAFSVGLDGMTKDEKLVVSWAFTSR